MERTTLTIGLGVAAVAAVAFAPRLQGLWTAPAQPEPVAIEVLAKVEPLPETMVQPAVVPAVQPVVVPEAPAVSQVALDHGFVNIGKPTTLIAEVSEPMPAPATAWVDDDGVIEMKTGGKAHVDTLPELGTPPTPEQIEAFWDDCPACGMG